MKKIVFLLIFNLFVSAILTATAKPTSAFSATAFGMFCNRRTIRFAIKIGV